VDGGTLVFSLARFTGSTVRFSRAELKQGHVRFASSKIERGRIFFDGAEFSDCEVFFKGAAFLGGIVDISMPAIMSTQVIFDKWKDGETPVGLLLPDGWKPQ
jgi:hypothetical protein